MLAVGLKKSEGLPLAQALKAYIQSNHTKEEFKGVEPAVMNFEKLRARVLNGVDKLDLDSAPELVIEYCRTLCSLAARLPFGKENAASMLGIRYGKVPNVKVPFTWYDAFRPNKKAVDYDTELEMAGMLFNLGALHSRRAVREKAQGQDLKIACHSFKIAAGVFDYLLGAKSLSNPAPSPSSASASSSSSSPPSASPTSSTSLSSSSAVLGSLSVDLSQDSLLMLSKLMLAQAQACFFEKAKSTVSSQELVAKLANGAAELFAQGHALSTRVNLDRHLGKSHYPWATHFHFQYLVFSAAACFFMAKHHIAKDDYGLEIAYLERAKVLLDTAFKLPVKDLSALTESARPLLKTIVDRLAAAHRDNEQIYFSPVPKPSNMEEKLEKKVVVQSIAFDLGALEVDPFAVLVQPEITHAAKKFDSTVGDKLHEVRRVAQSASDESQLVLTSLGLPAALEAMEPNVGLPADWWQRVREAQLKGLSRTLDELFRAVLDSAREGESLRDKIAHKIENEHKDDAENRAKFGSKWNRRSSEQITAPIMREMEEISKYLRDAGKSNAKLQEEWKENQEAVSLLEMTHEQLQAMLPMTQGESKSAESEALSALLTQLDGVHTKRQELIKSVEVKAEELKGGILNALLTHGKIKSLEQVQQDELHKFDPLVQSLDEIATQEQQMLQQIREKNDEFVQSRNKNDDVNQREQILQRLNHGLTIFNKLLASLNEGMKFYADLHTKKLQPLDLRVSDFLVARDMEKRMILDQLTQSLAGFSAAPEIKEPNPSPAVNPNLSLDHPSNPMYRFSPPPVSSAASAAPPSSAASHMPGPPASHPAQQTHAHLPQAMPVHSAYHHPQPQPQPHQQPPYQPQPYQPYGQQPPYYQPQPQLQPQQPYPMHPAQPPASNYHVPPGAGAPSQAPSAPTMEWPCATCTYLNPMDQNACSMCGMKRW